MSPFAMGKIPSYPEFLQTRTMREPVSSFDAWIEAGIGFASYQHGSAWRSAFDAGGVLGFVWRAPASARAETLLCGLLFPSRDSVGREYPLAIACEVPQHAVMHAPHVLPLALGDFLQRAHAATADFARLSPHELAGRIATIAPPNEYELARVVADYDAWCASTRVEDAWSAVFDVDPLHRSVAVIHALAGATESVRGVEAPALGPSVRLPLGRGGPASAAVWLDIVRRLCRWHSTVPTTFWTVTDGSMIVSLGDATPGLLSSLWYPTTEDARDLSMHEGQSPLLEEDADESPLRVDAPMVELLGTLSR